MKVALTIMFFIPEVQGRGALWGTSITGPILILTKPAIGNMQMKLEQSKMGRVN